MSDDRSAYEIWYDWFNERNRGWFGLGDAGAAPYVQCEAALSADTESGERQAFLFRTFDPDGWFMVLDTYDPDEERKPPKVEWIQECAGLLHGVVCLADWVADLVPDLGPSYAPDRVEGVEWTA